ncbi:MAG: 50S ribosomal protein L21 [Chloroflexi bacterium RBG_19FT_COMBO_62_14]|nr:MAG: 50S ribosomal protein L21 [Chloroflexi bacterium RBG_19FT_COMBO_62_14]
MNYAMFESGGKQYIAREGETVEVDHLPLDVGARADFNQVLLISDGSSVRVGTPLVEGARVAGMVVGQIKAPKQIVFKYIPKERYRRKKGHRQSYTRIQIEDVLFPGAKPSKKAEVEVTPEGGTAEEIAKPRKTAPKVRAAKKAAVKKIGPGSKSTAKKATTKKSASKKSVDG